MKKIEIKLFGAFRKYFPEGCAQVEIEFPISVQAAKQQIGLGLKSLNPDFGDLNLVADSALATSSEVLQEDSVISTETKLALLPPVCGG